MYACTIILWYVATRRVWARTGQGLARGMHRLTDRLIERLRRLPLDRFEMLGRGDLMTRLTGDTQRIINAAPALIGGPQALIRLSFGAVFALSVQPQLAGVAAGAMILVGLAIAAQMQVMSSGFARMAGDEMRLYDLLRGHVARNGWRPYVEAGRGPTRRRSAAGPVGLLTSPPGRGISRSHPRR